ncbi:MAG TPA: hypothetical protein VJ063_20420 [Verrucomicrobiae bacterium]|nr:hypothetical protein [Verrucomicrobiae bacterium]
MRIWASAVLLLTIVTGCVPSLNPIYTDKDLIFDPALLGKWGSDDPHEKWVFEKSSEKSYKLKQTDAEGLTAEFDARLVRLGDYKFLDLTVTNIDERHFKMNGLAVFSMIPAHLVLKLHEIGPKLKLSVIDAGWVNEWLEKNPRSLDHHKLGDNRYVITASTKDLQKFIVQHAEEEGLFGGVNELTREKD